MKRKMVESQLANLKLGRGKPRKNAAEARNAHTSIRLTPSGKEKLSEILKNLNITLADLLESVAHGEAEIKFLSK